MRKLSKPRFSALVPVFIATSLIWGAAAVGEPSSPAWWFTGDPPVISEKTENNKGPATIAQAKWMVLEALRGLEIASPTLATQVRADLEGTAPDYLDRIVDLSVPDPKDAAWIEKQKAPLNIGQLKALADPFYTRINAVSSDWLTAEKISNGTNIEGSIFPWTAETTDDENKAIANIGQLKAVFSLRFETLISSLTDTDGDGLPDDWEQAIVDADPNDGITSIADITAQGDLDGDGLSNYEEWLYKTDPLIVDIYNVITGTEVGETLSGTVDKDLISGLGGNDTLNGNNGDGLTTAQELALGTSPINADTDGDGVTDDVDLNPTDPTISALASDPGNPDAPVIELIVPTFAIAS